MAEKNVEIKTLHTFPDGETWISRSDLLYFFSLHAEELDKIKAKDHASAIREIRDRFEKVK